MKKSKTSTLAVVKEVDCKHGTLRCIRYFSPACFCLEVFAPQLGDFSPYGRFDTRAEALTELKASIKRFGGLVKGGGQ